MKETMEALKNMPKIKKALDYLKEDDSRMLSETLELCQIPVPSGMEREKALRVMEKM